MRTQQGYCFIFSAPSGCGKSTIVRELCARDSQLVPSISTTTRPSRPHEIDGKHYFFVSDARFEELIAGDEFLEYATVFKHRYGTQRKTIADRLRQGFDVALDIDWQGARAIKERAAQVVSFFLIPPSLEELRRRLIARDQDSATNVNYRMSRAKEELSHFGEFDHVLVNGDLAITCDLIQNCIGQIRLGNQFHLPSVEEVLATLLP